MKKNNRKNPNPLKINLKEIQESLKKIEISDEEIDKNLHKNKNISLQNKFNFPSAKNPIKKNRVSNKNLKNKSENTFSKLAEYNLKAINFPLNNSKFIC